MSPPTIRRAWCGPANGREGSSTYAICSSRTASRNAFGSLTMRLQPRRLPSPSMVKTTERRRLRSVSLGPPPLRQRFGCGSPECPTGRSDLSRGAEAPLLQHITYRAGEIGVILDTKPGAERTRYRRVPQATCGRLRQQGGGELWDRPWQSIWRGPPAHSDLVFHARYHRARPCRRGSRPTGARRARNPEPRLSPPSVRDGGNRPERRPEPGLPRAVGGHLAPQGARRTGRERARGGFALCGP